MKKIIIQNESDLEMTDAISLSLNVVKMGRISNDGKQYCYCSTFTVSDKGYAVYSDLNKDSDRLVVVNDPNVTNNPS